MPYDAVLFDLLSALLDSGALWSSVAGSAEAAARWRSAYLRITYGAGVYRPYEALVAEAAEVAGLDSRVGRDLLDRFGELEPWPDVQEVLGALATGGLALGVVTNCSVRLGRLAAGQVGVPWAGVVTAEEAGFYKPDPRPYLLALDQLGVMADRCLFVAGSPYDLIGTAKVGLATYWHDRAGLRSTDALPAPLVRAATLSGLPAICGLA